MRLVILSCRQSYKQIIGENTSQNISINVLVVHDQKHRYEACICLFSRSRNLLVDCVRSQESSTSSDWGKLCPTAQINDSYSHYYGPYLHSFSPYQHFIFQTIFIQQKHNLTSSGYGSTWL